MKRNHSKVLELLLICYYIIIMCELGDAKDSLESKKL